jgi:hypothetical protein
LPGDAKVLLRVTMTQALPPLDTFGALPSIVITLDGRVLSGGAVPAIFPGPLVMPIIQRQLTPAGWAKIVAAARDAGLLGEVTDFTGGAMAPGSVTAHLELVADGRRYDVTGDPNRVIVCIKAPCIAPPGTPEAFGTFISNLTMVDGWLAGDLGPQGTYAPDAYALIIGAPPAQDANLTQPVLPWPLAQALATFGKPLADGSGRRCGTASGDAAVALRPAFAAANQLTRWRDADGSLHGLTVRPLLPADGDSCQGLV